MADTRWLGRAGAVAEVNTVTIANTWAQNDTVTLTINGKDLVVTIGTLVTTTQVATTVKEAWEGSTLTDTSASMVPAGGGPDFTEHSEFTATSAAAVVTLTADTAGVPYNVSSGMAVTETTAWDGTATLANATAATGPNFVDNADNWDAGEAPGTSAATNVWIDNSDVSLLYGLFATANDLTSLNVAASFTGDIGLPKTNASGYPEYRADYLVADATTVTIGYGDGSGSGRIKLDSGSIQTALIIESTGSASEPGLGALIWKGTHASNSLRVQTGSVSVAIFNGELATLLTAEITAGSTVFGAGTTGPATLTVQGADVQLRTNVTTATITAGTITTFAAMTIGTLTGTGGTIIVRSTGIITAATIGGPAGCLFDCSQDNAGRTITTLTLNSGGEVFDPLSTLTLTNNVVVGSDTERISAS